MSFPVTIKSLSGRIWQIQATANSTVKELKQTIESSKILPRNAQRLIFGGKILEDDESLSEFAITKSETLFLVSMDIENKHNWRDFTDPIGRLNDNNDNSVQPSAKSEAGDRGNTAAVQGNAAVDAPPKQDSTTSSSNINVNSTSTADHDKMDKIKRWASICATFELTCPINFDNIDLEDQICLLSDGQSYSGSALKQWTATLSKTPKNGPTGVELQAGTNIYRDVFFDQIRASDWYKPVCPITQKLPELPVVLFPKRNQCNDILDVQVYDAAGLIECLQATWCKYELTNVLTNVPLEQIISCRDLNDLYVIVPHRVLWAKCKSAKVSNLPKLPSRGEPPQFTLRSLSQDIKSETFLDKDGCDMQAQHPKNHPKNLAQLNQENLENNRNIYVYVNIHFRDCTFTMHGKSLVFKNCLFTKCTFKQICMCGIRFQACRFDQTRFEELELCKNHEKRMSFCEFENCFVYPITTGQTFDPKLEHLFGYQSSNITMKSKCVIHGCESPNPKYHGLSNCVYLINNQEKAKQQRVMIISEEDLPSLSDADEMEEVD